MPSIYDLKPRFQALLRPMNQALVDHGVTANAVTLAATVGSLLVGGAIALSPASAAPLLLMPVWLFVRMALNAIDGMLSREHQMQSPLGAVLNEMGDVVSDVALYLPLALVPGLPPQTVVLVVIVGIMVEMIGVVSVQIGASRRYDGPFGKSDRAFAFGLICLLLGAGVSPAVWSDLMLWLMLGLSLLTLFNRGRRALAERGTDLDHA